MKQRKCAWCKSPFEPKRMGQKVCSPECAHKIAVKKREKIERAEEKVKRERLKTLPRLTYEAQVAFNTFIRCRDMGQVCVSCLKPLSSDFVGGRFDAGHYQSTGSAPHLRFHEDNCHGQCKQCNRYGAGRAVDYRLGLIQRIGLERVEALESDNQPRKYTREELVGIKKAYQAKVRQLKREDEA